MTSFQVIILAVIEGVTEFLPISSTGHLILAHKLLNIGDNDFVKTFSIFIQLGAITAVFLLSLRRLLKNREMYGKILTAFFPTALVGFLVYPILKKYLLGNSLVVCIALVVGGLVLLFFENWYSEHRVNYIQIEKITYKQSLAIGLFQAVAIIPGVSRSGATIIGSMLLGLSRSAALEFSFLLAIPTMVAAVGYDLLKSATDFTNGEWLLMALGFIISFISAAFLVRWLTQYVQSHSFKLFGVYRIIIGLVFLFFMV